MAELMYEDETYLIRGAVYEVYREMSWGYLEPVYQECLEREFTRQGIPFVAQGELRLYYKGEPLTQVYKPDFVCYDKIVVEIKAAREIAPEHKAQLLNYLRGTRMKLGLLVNFGNHDGVRVERLVY